MVTGIKIFIKIRKCALIQTMTAIVHVAEEGGYWATCLEIPSANGQGETKQECLADLKAAIKFCLDTEREER